MKVDILIFKKSYQKLSKCQCSFIFVALYVIISGPYGYFQFQWH